MTSPRAYDGVSYYAPSFASDTPIYDSLVAERGVPQIAPINVPAALPPAYDTGFRYEPAQPAMPTPRLALGPGPSSPSYGQQQYAQPQYAPQPPAPQPFAPQPFPGQRFAPQQGMPQQAVPQQRYPEQYGAQPQRPVAPVTPLRPVQYQEYPQQRGGFQGF
ncbi:MULTISPECIES: DUF6643 family protein [Streptacidiphilus]|uniref:DUF6643 family protein n=2 Tax=Streptacidiphilus TaxID=228398 RepID=A0ABV6UYC5_9ACTN|nr:DUF6643 family protein [Streptacidiphilus jeojiense]